MAKWILTLAIVSLCGCAMAREVHYSIKCTDCKTPYGTGSAIEFKVDKYLIIGNTNAEIPKE